MNKILNFERILCPVAQSHESDEGLRYAILIARSYGAKLSVLTCNDGSSPGDGSVEAMRTGIKRAVERLPAQSWSRVWLGVMTLQEPMVISN